MILEISIDDGDGLDFKSCSLLRKYNLQAVFYVPVNSYGYNNLDMYHGFQLGGHTVTHPSDLKLLSDYDLAAEVVGGFKVLEFALKEYLPLHPIRIVPSFCPPRGRYDQRVIDICKRNGYSLRTTKVLATTDQTQDIVRDTTIHAFNRNEYNGVPWLEMAKRILATDPEYFHLWWHSWEIEKNNDWGNLEEILKLLSGMVCDNNCVDTPSSQSGA